MRSIYACREICYTFVLGVHLYDGLNERKMKMCQAILSADLKRKCVECLISYDNSKRFIKVTRIVDKITGSTSNFRLIRYSHDESQEKLVI